MSSIHQSIKSEIELYSRHMSLKAAANRVKANRLGRVDFIVDEVLKAMEAAH